GATYIGCGPYRFTTTKEKLSPVLGLEGYQDLLHRCKQKNITTPVIAIGGIMPADIPMLMLTGISGVAVASALTNATEKAKMVKLFNQLLETQSEQSIKSIQ